MRPMFKAFVLMDVALVLIVVGVFAVQRSLLFPAVEEPLPASLPLGIVRLDVDDQFALYLEPTVSIGSMSLEPRGWGLYWRSIPGMAVIKEGRVPRQWSVLVFHCTTRWSPGRR